MHGIVVTTNGDDNLVEYSATAAIRLAVMRGWLRLYIYNGNLLRKRLVTRSKLPRAKQEIAGIKVVFAGRNEKSAGGRWWLSLRETSQSDNMKCIVTFSAPMAHFAFLASLQCKCRYRMRSRFTQRRLWLFVESSWGLPEASFSSILRELCE
jgi:hypothetical protein